MRITRTLAALVGVAGLAALLATATTTTVTSAVAGPAHQQSQSTGRQVHTMRVATAKFHNIATAESAGYVQLKDLQGISCIAMPPMAGMKPAAMGVHYVNPALIADPAIDPTAPEALVYAPDRDGTLRLAALEFIVDKVTWDTNHPNRTPNLFPGRAFNVTAAPNRYGLATFYSQHVWVWKSNPAGLLAMYNPSVHCAWA